MRESGWKKYISNINICFIICPTQRKKISNDQVVTKLRSVLVVGNTILTFKTSFPIFLMVNSSKIRAWKYMIHLMVVDKNVAYYRKTWARQENKTNLSLTERYISINLTTY